MKLYWLEAALADPDRNEPDPIDTTARHAFKRIADKETEYFAFYNATTTPLRIISVYFDRSMRGKL